MHSTLKKAKKMIINMILYIILGVFGVMSGATFGLSLVWIRARMKLKKYAKHFKKLSDEAFDKNLDQPKYDSEKVDKLLSDISISWQRYTKVWFPTSIMYFLGCFWLVVVYQGGLNSTFFFAISIVGVICSYHEFKLLREYRKEKYGK